MSGEMVKSRGKNSKRNVPGIESWIKQYFGYLLLLPIAVLVTMIMAYPILHAIALSFTDKSLLNPATKFIALANYIKLFKSPEVWVALQHSVILTAAAVCLQYFGGLGLAILLNQRVPGIQFFRSICMVTWVLPIVATVIMFDLMLTPGYGFFNVILKAVGLGRYTKYWFGSREWALWIIVTMHVWRNLPFFAIALLAGIQSIPRDIFEAAKVDGATSLQILRFITLPGIKYISMVMITIHILWTFNNFDFVYLSTGGGPVDATEVLATFVYKRTWEYYAIGYAASAGVFMMAILMIFTGVYIFLVKEREV